MKGAHAHGRGSSQERAQRCSAWRVYIPYVEINLLWLIICSTGALSCQDLNSAPRAPTIIGEMSESSQADSVPSSGGALIWSDEFEGPEGRAPNLTYWTHDLGGHGWGNQQLEYNTDRVENASLNGEGQLVITAIREDYSGNAYTSARLKTQGLFDVHLGRIEARIKLPIGQGIWPAFWMLGSNFPTVGWPHCGEIDIMEYRGQRAQESTGAIHGPGFSGGEAIGGAFRSRENLSDDYHVYAVEWTRQQISWFVDDERFFTVRSDALPKGSSWPFNQRFFLILNIAVGGSYVGAPDASTQLPQSMLIDYVRVFALPDES